MKRLAIFAIAALFSVAAVAQTYPVTTPVYVPNAIGAATTFTAPGVYSFTVAGVNSASVQIAGTCTSLSAALQASDDGSNWTTIGLYPVGPGSASASYVAAVTAPGLWKANIAAYNTVRVNVSALTASCTIRMTGAPGGFSTAF
jgi:hypothetical protein